MKLRLDENHHYVPLADAELLDKARRIKILIDEFAQMSGCSSILCRDRVMIDIIERVEKRRVYFHVFHGITMSEQNEISLYCFWIIKLAPFFDFQQPNNHVNAVFAAFLFFKMVKLVGHRMKRHINFTPTYIHNLLYAFLYRDISKEAIMLEADAFLA